MANVKKVQLDDSYLDGLNPITPNFGGSSAEKAAEPKKPETKKAQTPSRERTEYESVFLAPARGGKKNWRVYITEKHYDRINTIVKRLSPEGQPQSIVGYVWNVLEDHFRTYGKDIAALIDKAVQSNPFDEYK